MVIETKVFMKHVVSRSQEPFTADDPSELHNRYSQVLSAQHHKSPTIITILCHIFEHQIQTTSQFKLF